MARGFRYKRSIPVGYDLQGYVYFVSRRFGKLPQEQRKQLEALAQKAAGEYAAAVLEFVTTDNGATAVCTKYHLSSSTLERMVKRYYIAVAGAV